MIRTETRFHFFVDKRVSKANNLAKYFVEYKSVASEALNKLPSSGLVCKMVVVVDGIAYGFNLSQQSKSDEENEGKDNEEDHVVHTDKVVENVLRDVQENENVDSVKGKDNVEDHVVHTDKVVENVLRDLQDNENVDNLKGKDIEHLPREQPHLSSVVANTTSSLDPDAQPDSQPTHNTDHMPPEQLHLSHVVANTTSPVILLTPSPLLENTNVNPSLVVHHPNVIVIPDTPLAHKPSIIRQAVYTCRRFPHLAKLDEVTDVPCSTPATVHVPFPLFPVDVHDDTDFDIPDNDNEIPENVRGKRVAFVAEVFRSPYLQRNISLLGDLNQAKKNILDFILGDSYDESEVLFKSQSSTLTRSELKTVIEDQCSLTLTRSRSWEGQKDLLISLLEQKWPVVTSVSWMMPEVIDMFGIKSNVGRTDLLYLPTIAYTVDLEKYPSIWGKYVKCTYIPVDGRSIEKLYNIAGVLSSTPSYEHLKYIHMMDFDNVCVTQQKTIYHCGVFVLKFFSAVDNEILWKDTKYF
ncbi:hypothetical protein KSS87_007782 [Heliosperma pusillum]|nr:hypothetical protein KSS87_009898 [Heliosperma pusillum]KAH9615611.1 hypothetical protein KSS87_007782 [Heliosperma pusillum]